MVFDGESSIQGNSKVFWVEIVSDHHVVEVYRQLLVCLFAIEMFSFDGLGVSIQLQ